MIRFAETKPAGDRIRYAGSRYGRARFGSRLRSAYSDTGAKAYMIAVAEVTSPTSDCQLGNGRKAISPTMNASRIELIGTPRRLIFASPVGSAFSFPIA